MIRKMITKGIQTKYLLHTLALLGVALLLSGAGVWTYVRKELTESITNKYVFMNEKLGIALDELYRKSDNVMADCILYEEVQKSLQVRELEDVEKHALSKYFAYVDLEYVEEYCYVDNKQNVYHHSYSNLTYEEVKNSGLEAELGDAYSRTVWFWKEDTLFGGTEPALFVGRYVRSMNYAHSPGMLFFKMRTPFLDQIIKGDQEVTSQAVTGILDADGRACTLWTRREDGEAIGKMVWQEIKKTGGSRMILEGKRVKGGVLCAYRQKESQMTVFTFVPDSTLTGGLTQVLQVMGIIYLLVLAAAVVLSLYFSKRFTRPIQEISDAMTGFDGQDFTRTVHVQTNTELDKIGDSYNEMLGKIQTLLEEIKDQEKELRISEMNTLMSQINPHFLYNTLDTIYMLARMNGEETTMRMIEALSRYLRLSLSKGENLVTLEAELENVRSYMEIHQIRNENLFHYEIDCQVDPEKVWVVKLILQPLVENALKHGFADRFEGGLIRIRVTEEAEGILICVFNNGSAMPEAVMEKLNGLMKLPFGEIKKAFPEKKRGYGMINVVTRLRLKYGEEVKMWYETQETGTNCYVLLPKESAES
ncbi:sensor histidine kinase [Suipraeoptans intestinalis]|uniref:sensor histidine kinase n=1 Tax=Suipraeoptans intestinalis TaxID=2606628 RepID=UPI0023F51AE3|nr:sensor histidine kinase [Suipraeoptans intestinalis]MDD7770026.1 sensor histidine kinase [Suipraeoptans intestinalis]MDY3121060.1 sensor histidine kinase [Suipraeoptans intestinalis]